MRAQIMWGSNNIWMAREERLGSGLRSFECRVKGKRLISEDLEYNPLSPGDFVELEVEGSTSQALIVSRAERVRCFERFNRKGQCMQTIASNLDAVLIVTSLQEPPFRPRFVERCLLVARRQSLPCMVIINKADLGIDEDLAARVQFWKDEGTPCVLSSTLRGEGMREIAAYASGKIVALVGQSGAGKSSLLKLLRPGVNPRIGGLSKKYKRGTHTTVLAMAYESDEFTVIDTPGIRHLELHGTSREELLAAFPEIADLGSACRHRDCVHIAEDECAVLEGLERGLVHHDRYESYARLLQGDVD